MYSLQAVQASLEYIFFMSFSTDTAVRFTAYFVTKITIPQRTDLI